MWFWCFFLNHKYSVLAIIIAMISNKQSLVDSLEHAQSSMCIDSLPQPHMLPHVSLGKTVSLVSWGPNLLYYMLANQNLRTFSQLCYHLLQRFENSVKITFLVETSQVCRMVSKYKHFKKQQSYLCMCVWMYHQYLSSELVLGHRLRCSWLGVENLRPP